MEITASELQQQPSISPSENDTTIFFYTTIASSCLVFLITFALIAHNDNFN